MSKNSLLKSLMLALVVSFFGVAFSHAQELHMETIYIDHLNDGGGVRGLGGGDNVQPGGSNSMAASIAAKVDALQKAEDWLFDDYLQRPENANKIFFDFEQQLYHDDGSQAGNRKSVWVPAEGVWEYWILRLDFYYYDDSEN